MNREERQLKDLINLGQCPIGVNTCPCCVIYRECWDAVATRDMKHKIALEKSLELGYLTEEEVFEELL